MIILFGVLDARFYIEQRRELVNGLKQLTTVQSSAFAAAVWEFNIDQINSLLSDLEKLQFVSSAAVFDTSGELLGKFGDTIAPPESPEYRASTPLEFSSGESKESAGKLVITVHANLIREELFNRIKVDVLIVFVMALTLTGVTFFAQRVVIGRPIERLSDSIQKMRDENIREQVNWTSSDELGEVVQAYNEMQLAQAAAEDQLKQHQDHLEELIVERTKNLSEKEAQLRLALDNMPGGMLMVDEDLNFVIVNDQYSELFSFPDDLLVPGKSIVEMLHFQAQRGDYGTGDLDEMVERITKQFKSSESARYERRLRGGRVLEINVSRTPDGGAVAVARDITERKQAEEVIKESEAQFRTLVDNIPGIVYRSAIDADWTMQFISDNVADVSGYPASDFIDNRVRSFASLIHPDDVQLVDDTVAAALEKREPFIIDYRIVRADGDVRWVYEKGQGTFDEQGKAVSIDGTIYDNTARKQAEEEIAEKNQMLEDLSTKLSHYLSPQVFESIFSGERDAAISTDRKKLTVFFSDIKDFTATTEDLEPEELTFLLNDYLTKMTEIALEHGATIDKYIGDAMLLFFGDPTTKGVEEDALTCVRMAIAMQRRMVDLRAKWKDFGHERPIHMRIGINTGYCNVGYFGSDKRMDYTIIGGEVNLAARLEGIAEPDGIMMANETYALVRHEIHAEEQKPIQVKGISRKIRPYAVQGIFDDLDADRSFIRAENESMRLHVDLRKLDKDGQVTIAKELETCAARLREMADGAA